MKKLTIVILSVLLTSYSFAFEHAGKFEIGNPENAPIESGNLEVAAYSVIPLEPAYGMDDSQRFLTLEFYETPLLSSLLWKLDESGFSFGSSIRPYSGTLVKKSSPVNFDYGDGGLPSSHLFDVFSLRSGPLFIAEPKTNGRNSVPESSTMLLLGLGLIGLSAYGGRKKFKR